MSGLSSFSSIKSSGLTFSTSPPTYSSPHPTPTLSRAVARCSPPELKVARIAAHPRRPWSRSLPPTRHNTLAANPQISRLTCRSLHAFNILWTGQGPGRQGGMPEQLTSSAKFSHERGPRSCLRRDPWPDTLPSSLNIAESSSAENK